MWNKTFQRNGDSDSRCSNTAGSIVVKMAFIKAKFVDNTTNRKGGEIMLKKYFNYF